MTVRLLERLEEEERAKPAWLRKASREGFRQIDGDKAASEIALARRNG